MYEAGSWQTIITMSFATASCGLVADVDCAVGAAPCLDPSSAGGFVIDEAEVTFWGLCPECRQKAATPLDTEGDSL